MLATSTYHNNSIELPTCMLSLLLNNLVLMYTGDVNRQKKKQKEKKRLVYVGCCVDSFMTVVIC